jgi:hypothetical protein
MVTLRGLPARSETTSREVVGGRLPYLAMASLPSVGNSNGRSQAAILSLAAASHVVALD